MSRMGFSDLWIAWMHECYSSVHVSMLVNGSPSNVFSMERGVRQRDPLSPFLFLRAAEGLKCILDKAREMGLLKGISINTLQDDRSLIQFADDTLIFIPVELDFLNNLKSVLRCFELISILKVNFNKSSIVGLNVDELLLSNASMILDYEFERLPIKYLGLPLSNKKLSSKDWQPVIEKIQKKLAIWKGPLLSPAGRITLIKSSLSCIPLYFMSMFVILTSIDKKIEGNMRTFLWSGKADSKFTAKVAWNKVCAPLDHGGLFIKPLQHQSLSLLLKWLWKLRCGDGSRLWRGIVQESLSINSWWDIAEISISKLSHGWKGIRAACIDNSHALNLFFLTVQSKSTRVVKLFSGKILGMVICLSVMHFLQCFGYQ